MVPTLEENSLGRAYAISLVLDRIKSSWRVVSAQGDSIWAPLRDSNFAGNCEKVEPAELADLLRRASHVIAVKPLPDSLSYCLSYCDSNLTRLIVDIDDPDLELRIGGWRPHEQFVRRVFRPRRHKELRFLDEAVRKLPVIVSNPELQKKYGGTVIPHVRPTELLQAPRTPPKVPYIIFLGSPRRHKGLRVIEKSVSKVNRLGYELDLVISEKPRLFDRKWVRRIGPVGLETGKELLHRSLGTVVLITREPYASFQLPAKAIDAITAGVTLIYSATKPLLWATEGKGIALEHSTKSEVTSALITLLEAHNSLESDPIPPRTTRFEPEMYGSALKRVLRGERSELSGYTRVPDYEPQEGINEVS